jgi:hypothetical protein
LVTDGDDIIQIRLKPKLQFLGVCGRFLENSVLSRGHNLWRSFS